MLTFALGFVKYTHVSELLVEVRVPVQPRQLKLTIGKNIPAGQGINHRCLVASHCLEALAITQVFIQI